MTSISNKDILIDKVLVLKLFKDTSCLTDNRLLLNTKTLKYNSYLKYFDKPCYWILRVLKHDSIESIHVTVQEYKVGETEFSDEQISLNSILEQIEIISFNYIETIGLIHTARVAKDKLQTSQIKLVAINKQRPSDPQKENESVLTESTLSTQIPQITTEKIKARILDTTFVDNGVQCRYWHESKGFLLDFIVLNHNIKKEFEAIKGYFIKVLGTKYFNIEVTTAEDSKGVKIIKTLSKEIDSINASTIENVTFDYIKTNLRSSKYKNDHWGFSDVDKLREVKTDQNTVHMLPIDNNELFDKILLISKAKHFKNLKYLARLHNPNIMKLKYLLKPFSFLFLLKGRERYIFIWETLHTKEATYLWYSEKNSQKVKEKFHEIERGIKSILALGKLKYLEENADGCTRIYHDYSDPDLGFAEWTKTIENYL